ncbi:MAG TPA: enolase C-terminal domain-like protein, partial [Chloroflexota bacterium]
VQLAACIPNFAIQEYPLGEDRPPKSEIVETALRYDGHGSLLVPTAPGIGVELRPDAAERYPYKPRWLGTRLNTDGSVMDQ